MKKNKRKRFISTVGARENAKPIVLYVQDIDHETFGALTLEERYCVLVLGHVHDEISWLQRIMFVASRNTSRRTELAKTADLMQTTFLARLMLGKLFEFKKILTYDNSPIRQFLTTYLRPQDEKAGTERIEKILEVFEQEKWIRIARNKHFLHYPELADVKETLDDSNIQWQFQIAHGKKSSNTFHPTSDVLANYAWFRRVNPIEPMNGLDDALGVLTSLSKLTLDTLERSIGHFIDSRLMKREKNKEVKIYAPSINDINLGYFVAT